MERETQTEREREFSGHIQKLLKAVKKKIYIFLRLKERKTKRGGERNTILALSALEIPHTLLFV